MKKNRNVTVIFNMKHCKLGEAGFLNPFICLILYIISPRMFVCTVPHEVYSAVHCYKVAAKNCYMVVLFSHQDTIFLQIYNHHLPWAPLPADFYFCIFDKVKVRSCFQIYCCDVSAPKKERKGEKDLV